MITNEEIIIRDILGPTTQSIQPLAYAVEVVGYLLFVEKLPLEEIYVTKNVYPEVAGRLKQNGKSVARQIERLSNSCWDSMDKEQKLKYIGKELKDIHSTRDILIYFAYYSHFLKAYYEIYKI